MIARQLPFPKSRKSKAGRPPKGARAGVSHVRRKDLRGRQPVHVTLKSKAGIGYLRKQRVVSALEQAIKEARLRFGMRIVHYSIQGNHLHLLVEADDKPALSQGMQGLAIRLAKAVNRAFRRHGSVWADRYHAHVLQSPRETANALRYVLGNFAHHFPGEPFADPFSSVRFLGAASNDAPVASPRTWLLRAGWLRRGRGASRTTSAGRRTGSASP